MTQPTLICWWLRISNPGASISRRWNIAVPAAHLCHFKMAKKQFGVITATAPRFSSTPVHPCTVGALITFLSRTILLQIPWMDGWCRGRAMAGRR